MKIGDIVQLKENENPRVLECSDGSSLLIDSKQLLRIVGFAEGSEMIKVNTVENPYSDYFDYIEYYIVVEKKKLETLSSKNNTSMEDDIKRLNRTVKRNSWKNSNYGGKRK